MYEKTSKAQQQATQRYVAKAYDRVVLTMPKGQRDEIKKRASESGESMNAYIMGAVNARMETGK